MNRTTFTNDAAGCPSFVNQTLKDILFIPYNMPKRKATNSKNPYMSSKKKAPSNEVLNKKIIEMKKEVELKYVDQPVSMATTTTVGHFVTNIVDAGTSSTARIGNAIKGSSLQLSYSVNTNPGATTPQRFRILVFWDRQSNGASPGLFGASSSNALLTSDGTPDPTMAPYNNNTRKRYTILYDRVHVCKVLSNDAGVTAYDQIHIDKKYFKASRNIRYDGTGGGIADIVNNSLIVAGCSNVAANGPQAVFYSRFFYKDA